MKPMAKFELSLFYLHPMRVTHRDLLSLVYYNRFMALSVGLTFLPLLLWWIVFRELWHLQRHQRLFTLLVPLAHQCLLVPLSELLATSENRINTLIVNPDYKDSYLCLLCS